MYQVPKYYRVEFYVKKNRSEYHKCIDIPAKSTMEAKVIATDLWYMTHSEHMFRTTVRLIKDNEEIINNYFVTIE